MAPRSRLSIIGFGMLLLAALGANAGYQAAREPELAIDGRAAAGAAPVSGEGPAAIAVPDAVPPRTDFKEISARPLFAQTRRPVIEKAPEPRPVRQPTEVRTPKREPPPPRLPDLRLMAVVTSKDEGVALISDADEGAIVRLKVGESYQGWALSDLQRDRATLASGDRKIQLHLIFRDKDDE